MAIGLVFRKSIITPTPLTGNLLHTLDNPNAYGTVVSDLFGESVDICNSYAIVGVPSEDDAGGTNSGKAYIYNPATGTLLHTLDNPNPYGTSAGDRFAGNVAICDSYALVSAGGEDELGALFSGKAYIFDPATGNLLYTLNNPNAYGLKDSDAFSTGGVDICDSYAIVGAAGEDEAGGTDSGKAYIFNPATGVLLHTLDNPNAYGTVTNDNFGFAVGICDSYAIVCGRMEDDAGGTNSGKVYIFNPSTGALLHTIDNPNPYGTSENDYFGHRVAICDSYAIVGAPSEDDASGLSSGKAYIFNPATGALLHTLDNPNPYGTSENDQFGHSVDICDSYAIVGAITEDEAGGVNTGKVYIYNPATGALLYTLDNPNAYGTVENDNFGNDVGICDSYSIVGAYNEDDAGGTSSGKAYIFN